jgi:hypothetical protein
VINLPRNSVAPPGTFSVLVRCGALSPALRGKTVKFIVEILKLNGAEPPQVLHSFSHTASSIHMIRETMKAVLKSPQWPPGANGFRIISEAGSEFYCWPE